MSYIAYFIIATLVTLVTCVRASEPGDSDSIAGPVHCEAGLPVTKASVVLDAEFDVMTPDQRTDLADNLASHLHISVSALRVSALAGRQVRDSMALAWGPGNVAGLRYSTGSLVEWIVGCGDVQAAHIPVLQALERFAADGSLASRLGGLDVVGWHVTNVKMAVATRRHHAAARQRVRRQKTSARKTYLDLSDPIYYSGDGNDGDVGVKPLATPPPKVTSSTTSRTRSVPAHRPTTTTTSTTVTPGLFNNPPLVRNFLRLLSVRVGEVLNYTLPDDTFYDVEDGYTRRLRLDLVAEDGMPLARGFWLKFVPERQTILALPRPEHEGRHAFLLRAIDSQGETGQDRVRVRVLPRRRSLLDRPATYESTVRLDTDFTAFSNDVERPIDVMQRIAVRLFRNANSSALSMTRLQEGSVILSWTNTSLPTQTCDVEALRAIHSRIVTADGASLTRDFISALAPYRVLRYSSEVLGMCASDDRLVAELTADIAAVLPPATSPLPPLANSRPVLIRPIGSVRLTVGRLFNYTVPDDTFYDREDGNTRRLRLIFLSNDSMSVTRRSWVQLNEHTQTLYGLPTRAGRYEFVLVAHDAAGQMARDTFAFDVVERRVPINHEFLVQVDSDYSEFAADMLHRSLDFAHRIASLYRDVDASKITVLRITPSVAGNTSSGVNFTWTNHTVTYEPCPVRQLSHLMAFMFGPGDTISDALKDEFEPYYVKLVSADPLGPCEDRGVLPATQRPLSTTVVDDLSDEDISSQEASQSIQSVAMAVAVPVAIAAFVLLFVLAVLLVACFLFARSRRRGKLGQKSPPVAGAASAKAGVPVVFVDEIAERPQSPTKPLVLEREQPPFSPPPDYPRVGGNGTNGTLRSERRSLLDYDGRTPVTAAPNSSYPRRQGYNR